MQTVLLVENLKPFLETQSFTLFTHSYIRLYACGRNFARIQRTKSSSNNDASKPLKTDLTILLILRLKRIGDASLRNTHLLLIHIGQSGASSHLKQPMGQEPINEGWQMASKIKIVKIGQHTVFPRGVVGFFQVKEKGKNVFFFLQKHYE